MASPRGDSRPDPSPLGGSPSKLDARWLRHGSCRFAVTGSVSRERSARDEREELAQARQESPAERLDLALELSELTRELAEAAGAAWLSTPFDDLAHKALLHVRPLRAAAGKRP